VSKRLTGLNPLAYMGVEPSMPPNMYMATTSPTPSDVQNFNLGDFWVNTTTNTLYVLVNQGRGVATWVTTFGGAASQFVTDSGTATDAGGIINIFGDATHIDTSAVGNTITLTLDANPLEVQQLKIDGQIDGVLQADASGNITATNGTNGQLLIAGTGGPEWASLTAGSNISIVPGSHTITISASGSGGGGATDFITDIPGPATETGGNITMEGGNNITTNGATPHTVIFNLTGTTNHAVQVGNSTGSLTSLAVATNGQVLLGSTGANPVFASLTSGDGSITFTPGAGTLSLQAVGGGGAGGVIVTPYNTPGSDTWTKNANTKYVTVYGWSGGGGGGSGAATAAGNQAQGGGGGGNGAVFKFSGPATFFGATESVFVGSGGAGGSGISGAAAVGNNGSNGTASTFGSINPPLFTSAQPIGGGTFQGGGGGNTGNPGMGSGGCPGGIFIDGQPSRAFFASSSVSSTNGVAVIGFGTTNTRGGGGSGNGVTPFPLVGADGAYAGGNGAPFNAWNGITPTCGGQGGSSDISNNYSNGGSGGNVFSLDGLSTLIAGGIFGVASGSIPGGDGNPAPTSGGMVFGGTGGGGGAANALHGGNGGDGGLPGGGAGGGGASRGTSGNGGNGGNGLVIVIEWT
jgi:hypothetical protein